jgi:ribosomal protein L16 Arg81 hydroxylase
MMHELGEKVLVASTTTVGTSGATLPHIDKADAIAVQVEGAKQWFIYRDPETDPVPGMRERPRETEPQLLMELTLEAGDMLIVPGGYFHRCETPAGRSHHVTFFVYPMTAPRILDLLFREMAEDPAQRAPIRFAADDARAQEALRERIVRRVRELPYEELLERHFATDHSPGRHEDW